MSFDQKPGVLPAHSALFPCIIMLQLLGWAWFEGAPGHLPIPGLSRALSSVFLEAKDAHSVLKRFPRANEFLEELRQGTIERECMEEICSYEEVKEVFENKEKTMEFWKGYPNAVYSVRDPSQSSDAMYVVVPLLGVALLIVIALFIIWRCQLQKATRHHPSYAQNRCFAVRLAAPSFASKYSNVGAFPFRLWAASLSLARISLTNIPK
ncbi:transmembrane gamma-carboxyglutamic acid protein 3 isoform X3 [Pan paniscus]|uniref:transmembrane gamma-carboxyglutamic acid protein 3 isoform X3 n=1 Tax=Pan paniscus TaxID=9597 RepID=UPI0007DBCEBE|nr:transmembrane gamma-carboxyglutamic acid protein 3 isoform X3 [Pan paniscus]XP_054532178.1 transmembrane gamma-carboxyglutamic acid protein 3 isoform X3 [Pan troglodytes]